MRKSVASIIAGAVVVISAAAQGNPPADFVLIRGGTFQMGSPESEDWRSDDETLHRVTLSPFYLAKHEVTQRLFREVTGKSPSAFSGDDLPVESVSWLDAGDFSGRLFYFFIVIQKYYCIIKAILYERYDSLLSSRAPLASFRVSRSSRCSAVFRTSERAWKAVAFDELHLARKQMP